METFALTLEFNTLQLLLALVATEDLQIHQIDVASAYLAGEIDEEELQMRLLEGLQAKEKVYRLNKGIYSLKQLGRIQNKTFRKTLLSLRFVVLDRDNSVYLNLSIRVILALYIDDLLLFYKDLTGIQQVKSQLQVIY